MTYDDITYVVLIKTIVDLPAQGLRRFFATEPL